MGARFHHYAPALCAGALAVAATSLTAQAQLARNCPKVRNQFVVVSKSEPTAFSLDIADLGNGTVSIFQYPLGGILQQVGPTPLNFLFVPTTTFGGTTSFTYRLIPPAGCPRSTQLVTVTLAAGVADDTDAGVNEPPEEELEEIWPIDACGTGLPLLLPFTILSLVAARRRY